MSNPKRIPCRTVKFNGIRTASILKRNLKDNFVLVVDGNKDKYFEDSRLQAMQFLTCSMERIPRSSITLHHVPNLRMLRIVDSPIQTISNSDLEGYYGLTDLEITGTEIAYLPGKLFDYNPSLQNVILKRNNIRFIEEGIIAAFMNMNYVDLTENPSIDVKYDHFCRPREDGWDSQEDCTNVTFSQFESAIRKCKPPRLISDRNCPPPIDFEGTSDNAASSSASNGENSNKFNDRENFKEYAEIKHFQELKEMIVSEIKLRRQMKLDISKTSEALNTLDKKVQKDVQESNKRNEEVDSEMKKLSDIQAEIEKQIEKNVKEFSDRLSELNSECSTSEKNIDKLNEGLKAFKSKNDEALKKLTDEVESLTKMHTDQQNEIDKVKKTFESHKKSVNDLIKILIAENDKKLKSIEAKFKKEIAEANKKSEKQSNELKLLQSDVASFKARLDKKIEEIPAKRQRLSEYKIILGKEEFKVHKSFLLAHSPKIASMVRESPQTESFELKEEEISVESFKEILNFMYLGLAPSPQSNLISLYAASCHLEMNTLATIIAGMLKDKINPDNAFDILIYCNEYGKEELKMKAFEEFSKNFPERKLNPEIASQTHVLAKLNATKMEVENILGEKKQN